MHKVVSDRMEWWRSLTVVEQKATEFGRETYFREAWADLDRAVGGVAAPLVQRLVSITFKPEAVAGRRIAAATGFLAQHGFLPIACRRVRLDRYRIRDLWRFQWNVATLDRLAVADLHMSACDSLWIAFWDATTPLRMPATVRFRGIKGPAYPPIRRAGQLRHLLGGTNRMLTFIHAADEPIDVVRELGILFEPVPRRLLIAELASWAGHDNTGVLSQVLAQLHEDVPAVELNVSAAVQRFEAELDRSMSEYRAPLLKALRAVRAGERLQWDKFVSDLTAAAFSPPLWDLIQIGAEYIQHDLDDTACVIDDDGRSGWLGGQGNLLDYSPSGGRFGMASADCTYDARS